MGRCTLASRIIFTSGWLNTDSLGHCRIVQSYFVNAGGFGEPQAQLRTLPTQPGDPLYAVYARCTTAALA